MQNVVIEDENILGGEPVFRGPRKTPAYPDPVGFTSFPTKRVTGLPRP
jgi:hypothetical protein